MSIKSPFHLAGRAFLLFIPLVLLVSCQSPTPKIDYPDGFRPSATQDLNLSPAIIPSPTLPSPPAEDSTYATPTLVVNNPQITPTIFQPVASPTPVVAESTAVETPGPVQLATFDHQATYTVSLDFSPDGNLLAVPSSEGIDLYQAPEFKKIRTMSAGEVHFVAFNPGSDILVTDGLDPEDRTKQVLQFWRVEDGIRFNTIPVDNPHWSAIDSLAFSPDGQFVAVSLWENHTVRIWSTSNSELQYTLQGDRFEFSPDSKWVVVSTETGELKVSLHSTVNGALYRRWDGQRAGFSPSGKLWVENQGAVRIMDLDSGRASFAFSGKQVTFTSDGQILVVFEAGMVRLYDAQKGTPVQTLVSSYLDGLQLSAGYEVPMYFSEALQFQFSPSGETIAGLMVVRQCNNCQTIGSVIVIWRVSDGKIIEVLEHPEFTPTPWFTFSAGGNLLVISNSDANLVLWSLPVNKY